MTLVHAVILGIVEGLTEFLPISSTAHLIFTSNFLGLKQTEFTKFFEVFIQSGAVIAIVLLYFQYIFKNKSLIRNLIISFIPTAIVGLVLHKLIKTIFFESSLLILSAFFIVGLIFLVFEYLVKKGKIKPHRRINEMKLWEAITIGLGQATAVIPGVSRAGAVIITMMGYNFRRDESALYSFLLAVPTIVAAGIFDLLKTDFSLISNPENLLTLAVGFITSFICALVVVKLFIKYLQKNTLIPFGLYRILLALLLWGLL